MRIRGGLSSDIAEVLALWHAAEARPSVTDDAESLDRLLTRDPDAMFVAEADGAIVGTLIACFDGWRGNMYRLAVAPAHRRAGIALRLIAHGEDRLRALGCRRITALVVGDDDPATSCWAAAGYEWQAEIRRYVR
jgi:ribosomal protein S18 acetylase RimI-like enzyme